MMQLKIEYDAVYDLVWDEVTWQGLATVSAPTHAWRSLSSRGRMVAFENTVL